MSFFIFTAPSQLNSFPRQDARSRPAAQAFEQNRFFYAPLTVLLLFFSYPDGTVLLRLSLFSCLCSVSRKTSQFFHGARTLTPSAVACRLTTFSFSPPFFSQNRQRARKQAGFGVMSRIFFSTLRSWGGSFFSFPPLERPPFSNGY